jgi:DNA-binding GntR family transcriptional regulator
MTGSSLYQKVAEDIKAAIAAGTYPANTKLPSESELAERYSVSRGTIRQAFAALRADGVIASRRGARRIVVGGPRLQSFGELLSFSRWARAMGEVPAGRVIALDRRPATAAEAERLALPADEHVWYLVRVRLLSERPVMVERATYPDEVGALVAEMDLTVDSITAKYARTEPCSRERHRCASLRSRLPSTGVPRNRHGRSTGSALLHRFDSLRCRVPPNPRHRRNGYSGHLLRAHSRAPVRPPGLSLIAISRRKAPSQGLEIHVLHTPG